MLALVASILISEKNINLFLKLFVSQWFNCHLRGCGVLISPFNSLMCVCEGRGLGGRVPDNNKNSDLAFSF